MLRLPNSWQYDPSIDQRFVGLLDISFAISDAFDLASGYLDAEEVENEPTIYKIWMPTRLAERMREAAQRIDEMTLKTE